MTIREYHSKPIIIEAVQWDSLEQSKELIEWGNGKVSHAPTGKTLPAEREHWGLLAVETTRGSQMGMPYDWLIRDITGNFSFMDPETFEATYIAVAGDLY